MIQINSIRYEVKKPSEMRYVTVGDWFENPKGSGNWIIQVADLGDWRYNLLVAMHEMFEAAIVCYQGIDEQAIADFDMQYERERANGLHSESDEPGFDSKSPYRIAHTFATSMEMALAANLDVDWNLYDNAVMGLEFPDNLLQDYRDEIND